MPRLLIQVADSALHYIDGGLWMKEQGFRLKKRLSSRNQIFEFLADQCKTGSPLYLEFGVFKGETIRKISSMITNEMALFHGFDSFLGLPERWNRFNKQGHFSTKGRIPEILDSRVSFFSGWFDFVLPNYALPPHDLLIINIDCDLYSSTKTVLKALTSNIKVGTYLYFDEFYDRNHERKAFEEFLETTGFKFDCLLATKGLAHVLFVRSA